MVALKDARKFLYYRLRRLLVQQKWITLLMENDEDLTHSTARSTIERFFYQENLQKGPKWEDDQSE